MMPKAPSPEESLDDDASDEAIASLDAIIRAARGSGAGAAGDGSDFAISSTESLGDTAASFGSIYHVAPAAGGTREQNAGENEPATARRRSLVFAAVGLAAAALALAASSQANHAWSGSKTKVPWTPRTFQEAPASAWDTMRPHAHAPSYPAAREVRPVRAYVAKVISGASNASASDMVASLRAALAKTLASARADDATSDAAPPKSSAFRLSTHVQSVQRFLTPCVLWRAGLSLGMGALGFTVGIPYVPGLTDNLLVGVVSAVLPLYTTAPCDGAQADDHDAAVGSAQRQGR